MVSILKGAIELAVLAEYYGREIAAYDIQTTRCDLYGQVSISCCLLISELGLLVVTMIEFLIRLNLSTGKEVWGKSHADIWWAPLWCFGCMGSCLSNSCSLDFFYWIKLLYIAAHVCVHSLCILCVCFELWMCMFWLIWQMIERMHFHWNIKYLALYESR